MTAVALTYGWRCYVCDAAGTGTDIAVQRAAEKHLKTHGHAVSTWGEPMKESSD